MNNKRIHFKGRGKTERPICPHCQQDLKRSYVYKKNKTTGKWQFVATGWECSECEYKQWDHVSDMR